MSQANKPSLLGPQCLQSSDFRIQTQARRAGTRIAKYPTYFWVPNHCLPYIFPPPISLEWQNHGAAELLGAPPVGRCGSGPGLAGAGSLPPPCRAPPSLPPLPSPLCLSPRPEAEQPYLHAAVVNDHGLEGDLGVQLSHLLTAAKEEPIPQLPGRRRRRDKFSP